MMSLIPRLPFPCCLFNTYFVEDVEFRVVSAADSDNQVNIQEK